MMVSPVSRHIPVLRAVVEHIQSHPDWIVLVTPEDKVEKAVQAALTAVRPANSSMGGRTLLCPDGGRVTVTVGDGGVHGDGFFVMFLGFDAELSPRDQIALHKWRHEATGTVTRGEQPGELKITLR